LDGFNAEQVLLMIGTNNLQINTDYEIIEGLRLLVQGIRSRQPKAQIILIGLLPRRGFEGRIEELNLKVERLAGDLSLKFADLGGSFLNKEKKIRENMFSDGLHPNKNGYLELSTALKQLNHN
jgi:lysophospholipase L1-like esterase